jgi:hypothetical protein
MPTLQIMVWNVENFGNNVAAKGNYVPLCNFIAYVVAQQQVDILVIQEVRSGGAARLGTLCQSLDLATGGDWYYDHIRGALIHDPRTTPPTTFGHTKYSTDHDEGYALFWNNARHNEFVVVTPPENISQGTAPGGNLPGTVPANALTLVYQGRDASAGVGPDGWFNAPNFDVNRQQSVEYYLDFCRSAWLFHRGDQSAADSRRPCTFTIKLDPTNKQSSPETHLVPVTVFHNISNDANTSFNLELSGFSRQLYQVYDPDSMGDNKWVNAGNTIIAGDFNIDTLVDNADRQAYYTYHNPYDYVHNVDQGGADALPALFDWPHFDRSPATIVQLRDYFYGPLIQPAPPAAFLKHSIDHIFYHMTNCQPAKPPGGWVVDLFDMVMRSHAYDGLRDIIKDFMTPIAAALGPSVWNRYTNYPYREKNSNTPATQSGGKKPIIGNLLKWYALYVGIQKGRFSKVNGVDDRDDARTAAEFIRQLVSDHLPTVFSFDY